MIDRVSFIIIFTIITIIGLFFTLLYFKNCSDKFGNVNQQIDKKVAIGFMVRNAESYLEKNINKLINFMNNNFGKNNFDIHYFENDSNDKTIDILDKFKNENNNFFGENHIFKNKMSSDMCLLKNCKNRFQFLAGIRQKLLDSIIIKNNEYGNSEQKTYDYYLLNDLDFQDFNEEELKNMFNTIIKNNYDGIFAMSKVCFFGSKKDCRVYDNGVVRPAPLIVSMLKIKKNKIEKIDSGFGGFGIYSMPSIRKYNAKYNLECDDIEHIDFNKNFDNLCIYHNFNPEYTFN